MLIVNLVFHDQYRAGRVSTQNVTSSTMASTSSSEPYLPRQKHDLAFLMILPEIKREEFSPVVLCDSSVELKVLCVIYSLFAFSCSLKVQINFLELIHVVETHNDNIKSSN